MAESYPRRQLKGTGLRRLVVILAGRYVQNEGAMKSETPKTSCLVVRDRRRGGFNRRALAEPVLDELANKSTDRFSLLSIDERRCLREWMDREDLHSVETE
jgi:hypothetical protein